jgi:hypothetical protein
LFLLQIVDKDYFKANITHHQKNITTQNNYNYK